MKEKYKIQLAVVGVLIVFLIVLIIKTFGPKSNGIQGKRGLMALIKQEGSVAPAREDNRFTVLEAHSRELTLKRDPFFVQQGPVDSAPVLEGILWDDQNPTAIINGVIVEIGGKVPGHTVIDIKRDSVILHDGTKNGEFKLGVF